MGSVIDLSKRRKGKAPAAARGHFVTCVHCGEPHPVVRATDGTLRCVTAFADGERWFCRNRGCRAAWLARRPRSR